MIIARTARLGLACSFAFAAYAGTARADEGVAIKNLLGSMGIIAPDKDPIRYRERAPLVLPPKMELREPSSPESYASSNPQWPNDPDVAAKKRRKAIEGTPVTTSEVRRMSENNPRLTIDEIREGRNPGAKTEFRGYRGDNGRDVVLVAPEELMARRKGVDEELPAGVEPSRRTLTDPPTGMRRQTSTAKVSANSEPRVDQQALDANPMNWLRKQFSRDEDE